MYIHVRAFLSNTHTFKALSMHEDTLTCMCTHTTLLSICMIDYPSPPHSHSHTALSSFSPASVALTDLIQSQLSLIRFSMETTQRQVGNIYASTQSGHHYTTLEETKAVSRNIHIHVHVVALQISFNRPSV